MSGPAHDQTRSQAMPVLADGQSARLSCNEVASLCMKAARGAGMSWGMAEEAGFAAAWLVAHGIDGPTLLCAHLALADGRDWSDLCPTVKPGTWRNAAGQALCPIILGATMCDYAALPEGPAAGCSIVLGPVSAPILLVPFLAQAGAIGGLDITLSWADGSVCIDAAGEWLAQARDIPSGPPRDLTLSAGAAGSRGGSAVSQPNAQTTAATVAALNAFAMRTTVPASDASRAGAGSTLGDND